MNTDEILASLNDRQREAASSQSNKTLIIAGAGTGKTQTLTSRVAWLIANGVDPKSILLLTFTNKAAEEMTARAQKLAGEAANNITASTFHGFCNMMLRKYGHYINIPQTYTIVTPSEERDIYNYIKGIDKDHHYPKSFPKADTMINLISEAYNKSITIDETFLKKYKERTKLNEIMPSVVRLNGLVEEYKKQTNQYDYDDLMKRFIDLMDTDAADVIRSIYRFILVDEYQDTNNVQEEILVKLTKSGANLTVVGDDYQSIYAFRGANVEHFLSFEDRYPDCKMVTLVHNYRSTQEILDFSNKVMRVHADFGYYKQMVTRKRGDKPKHIFGTAMDETTYVMDGIKAGIAKGLKLSDMAVLSNKSRASAMLQAELEREHIPYEVRGGTKFFDREDVGQIIAMQKILAHSADQTKWATALRLIPNIGERRGSEIASHCVEPGFLHSTKYENSNTVTDQKIREALHDLETNVVRLRNIQDFQAQTLELMDYYGTLRENIIKDTGRKRKDDTYNDMIEALEDFRHFTRPALLNLIAQHASIYDWLDYIVLDGRTTTKEQDAEDKLVLSTIHSAKGLEWDTVFMIHCTDGEFPMANDFAGLPKNEEDEALRCFYVAATRAKNTLVLSTPSLIGYRGETLTRPTRFIRGAEDCLEKIELDTHGNNSSGTVQTAPKRDISESLIFKSNRK